ncbi:hypothetical protein [Sorangium sp. So ce388]|uniref:hypothetical protein n=1 Tax=Sorangium sp. So ce388 TaxID=3133309 RepID=UPI003F5B658C
MRFQFYSQYTDSPRADAIAALIQLREAVVERAILNDLYRGMAIAEARLEALGASFGPAARRLNSYAPPTVAELDEMLRALEDAGKASCEACGGFRCSACDQSGLTFDAPRAA